MVNTTLKSGSNDWHGDVFDYFRNKVFDANSFQNNLIGAPKPKHNQHQWGGVVGGPIRKNKDLIFVSFEGWRERIGFPAVSSVPPTLLRDGLHFTDLGYKIYDPATTEIYTLSLHDALPIYTVIKRALGRPQAAEMLVRSAPIKTTFSTGPTCFRPRRY